MTKDQKSKILSCLKNERHCVVSTVSSSSEPQVATVGFAENDDLEIVFATWKWTRKYQNLQHDKRVGFVFGFESGVNVQYQGIAEEIPKTDPMVQLYLKKKPRAEKYLVDPEQVYYKVAPTWLRYSDFRAEPNEIFEVNNNLGAE